MGAFSNLSQIADLIRSRKKELDRNRRSDCLKIVLDLKAIAQLRIQTEGKNYENNRFEYYNPIYAKRKKEAGYDVSNVNFTVTGQLWRNSLPVVLNETVDSIAIRLGPTNDNDQAKADGQIRKRGNIFRPSEDELQIVSQLNQQRVLNRLNT